MSSNSEAYDQYVLSPDQKAKYETQFVRICGSRSDLISGEQAKTVMLQSGLSPAVLAHIWSLSDVDVDGRMDINEFCIALHLIALKLKGLELPLTLPQSLKVLVSPPSFAAFTDFGAFATPSAPMPSQPSPQSSTFVTSAAPTVTAAVDTNKIQRSGSITSVDYPASMILTEWAIPQPSKLKYTQQFNTHDRTRTGFLTGPQARNILIQSQLPQSVLAQIWNLADIDADGRLTCDEFVVAMHLIDCVRAGDPVPVVLSPDLVPPSYRRKRSLSGVTAVPTITPAMQPNVELIQEETTALQRQAMMATFEDKRRENFEKGQAELDRRRQALLELQKREREERERKEREEQQKKELIRLELERKRQAELEKQLQRQREIEAEKEEQRRKHLEQREAARREMERQRMIEWENTRKQDLTNQMIKTQEEVHKLRSRKKGLVIDMEQVNNKLNELNVQVAQTRKKVVDVKSEIDAMRVQRDQKLGLLSSIKAQIKGLSDRQLYIEQEKSNLMAQLKNSTTAKNAASDQFALQNKQLNINQLKSQLEHFEQEKAQKSMDLANNSSQLKELRQKLQEMVEKTRNISQLYENKRETAQKLREECNQQNEVNVNSSWGTESSSDTVWPTSYVSNKNNVSISKFKYRVLYAFHARNEDELTIEPGDIVIVDTSACSEPGWLTGEMRGHIGWFPEAYVERLSSDEAVVETSVDTSRQHTTLEGIAEAPENGVEQEVNNAPIKSFITSEESCFQPPASSTKTPEPSTGSFQVLAIYPWNAKEDNHLSFSKGDIIVIKEQQDMWWFGELGANSGWFPKTYVKPIDSSDELALKEDEYYISLYPFDTQESGDLPFDANELIKVTKKEGEWWTGSIGESRIGVFPSNYVRLAEPEEIPNQVLIEPTMPAPKTTAAPPLQNQVSAPTPPPSADGDRRGSESCDSPKPSKKSKLKKPEIVTVIAPYKASGPEQLSLERGQLIQVRKKTSSGWWEGESQMKGKKRQVGWFPASYVKSLNPSGGSGGSSARSTPDLVRQLKATDDNELEKVMALYSFKAQHDDELSFEANDIIKVLAKDDTTWWKGLLVSSGAIGLFPSNHVEIIRDSYEEINEYYIENDYVDVDCVENNDNSHDLTDEERHRQNCINEFIDTEKAFVHDMEIVIDVFQVPLRENKCLNDVEIEKIFVNWPQLVRCSQKFLKSLRNRKRKSNSSHNVYINEISDIFCHYLIKMADHYIKFCSRQLAAAKLIQYKTENDPNFNEMAKKCSQDSRANRLPLSSYLLKPMQRITKYPLLIKKILQNTPQHHSDYEECVEALKLSENLCKRINEACRDKENTDRLEWIQSHVRCESLDQTIVFNSETNCLGPRQLLHSGSLIKANSGKEMVGFLFSDFLLLTVPTREIGKIVNVFASDKAMSSYYRIYKEPLLLSDITIADMSPFEANMDPTLFQFYIKSQEKYLILKAISVNERSLWIKAIDSSSRKFRDIKKSISNSKSIRNSSLNHCKKFGRLLITILEGVQLYSKNTVLNAYCQLSIGNKDDADNQSFETKCVRIIPSSPTATERPSLNSKSSTSSSNSVTNNHNQQIIHNLYKVKWNDTTQFIIYDNYKDSFLSIKCFDSNPYAPHSLIGSAMISMKELAEVMDNIQGPLNKSFRLTPSDNSLNAEPILYLKLDLHYFDH